MEALRGRSFAPIGWALTAAIVAGFARTFYLRYWFDVPPLATILYVHGIVFSAWVALFLVQVRLVAVRNMVLHRALGIAGGVLAALMVIVGLKATVYSAAIPRAHVMGLTSAQFSLIPLVELFGFAALVTAAIVLRRQPAWHKRLMVLAMIMLIAPAIARLISLTGNGARYLALQTGITIAFIGWGLAHDWIRHRLVHPAFALWGAVFVLSWPLRMWFAQTAAWQPIGNWVAALGN